MNAMLDRFLRGNPLIAHGVRTHRTGIVLAAREVTPKRRPRWDVAAPKVHLGHAGR